MTHDPMCQLGTRKTTTDPEDCHSCDYIARIRADTLDKAVQAVREPIYGAMVDDEYHCDQPCCEFSEQRESAFCDFHDRVTRAAVEAINALRGES